MNKWEAEVQKSLLDSEEAALKELEKQYAKALKDIGEKVKSFQADIDLLDEALSQDGLEDTAKARMLSMKRSKIYQQQYQQALQGQVSAILDKMHGDNYATIDGYLHDCYADGYIGTMYDIAGQGIPLVIPIDQAAAVKAVLTDSKVSGGLYNALGVDVGKLKKKITQEISRGIASSLPYRDIARNIASASGAPLNRAKVIARTEGHRIQQTGAANAQAAAKAKGADVLKQWDATLDARTRESHALVDGELRELEEPFSNGLMLPGDPDGGAAEVVNCRCVANTRARWALDEAELQTLKERTEYFGLEKTENFEEYREKSLKAETEKQWGVEYGNAEVDFEYIGSDEYRDKFSLLSDSKELNDALFNTSITILKHCDGTNHEDLYLINPLDGSVFAKVTDTVVNSGIVYSEEFTERLKEAHEKSIPIVGIHNHPHGTPPSPDDFRKSFDNGYDFGVVVGHNGQLYRYETPMEAVKKELANEMSEDIGFFYQQGTDIDRSSEMVYDAYGLVYIVVN